MSRLEKIIMTIILIAIPISIFVYWKDIRPALAGTPSTESREEIQEKKKKKKSKKEDKKGQADINEEESPTSAITIIKKWEVPYVLTEISGIAYLTANQFACIQDEKGTIYLFNRSSGQIDKEIPFAGPGDYEGITVNGHTAYVVRADGRLYEVPLKQGNKPVKEYQTSLTAEHNVEGLCFDKENNRLLLAIKNNEPGNPGYKGIYAFGLSNERFIKEPVFIIELAHEVFKTPQGRNNKEIMPSAIGIHPLTSNIYITDGPQSRLLMLDRNGKINKLYELGKDFAQPEGITFSPQGELFISNEGTKQPGNIMEVEVK